VGVNLTGTITGATWLGERTISFNFDENGSSVAGNEDTPGAGNDSGSGSTSESGGSAGFFQQVALIL
jgi:hypothetical protein